MTYNFEPSRTNGFAYLSPKSILHQAVKSDISTDILSLLSSLPPIVSLLKALLEINVIVLGIVKEDIALHLLKA